MFNTVPVVRVRVISQVAVSRKSTLPLNSGSKLVNADANHLLSGENATSLTPRLSSKLGLIVSHSGCSQNSTRPLKPDDSVPGLLPEASKPPEGINAMLINPSAVCMISFWFLVWMSTKEMWLAFAMAMV